MEVNTCIRMYTATLSLDQGLFFSTYISTVQQRILRRDKRDNLIFFRVSTVSHVFRQERNTIWQILTQRFEMACMVEREENMKKEKKNMIQIDTWSF